MTGVRVELEAQLSAFIAERLLDRELKEGVDPLAADAVDSLGLEQLVHYIESELGVAIHGEEMVRANFGSVPALAAFLDSKRGDTD